MANITLTNLPTVTSLNGTEPLLGVQSNASVQITTGQIVSLARGGSGVLPLAVIAGGTGDTTLTSFGLLYGNGTSPVSTVTPPAGSNYVLVASAGSAPSWQPTIPVSAGVDSVAFGTTGLTPVAATSGVVSVAFGTTPTAAGIYSPATNQIALSTNSTQQLLIDASGNTTITGTVTAPFYVANGTITGSLNQGAYSYGTLNYSDSNIFQSFNSSVNSYNQQIMQNTNSGASASINIIVSNNLGTASTYFGEFGMNSSGFTGSGAFNAANTVYLDATSADLAIGTTTANAIHFVVNSGATDAMTISSAGVTTIASAIITSLTTPLVIGGSTASSTLTLESTSAAGTSDSIIFKTGSQSTAMTISTAQNVVIGSATPAAGQTLRLSKNMTGAVTTYGILNNGTIQSDSNSSVYGNFTQLPTQAASFTLTNLISYAAALGTVGIGSQITSLYGYQATASLIGATNNYGFYSSIPSVTTDTISNVSADGTTATITTSAAHGYGTGQSVIVAAVTNTSLNGTFTITSVPSTTTFTYLVAATVSSQADTGSTYVNTGRYNFYASGNAPNLFQGSLTVGNGNNTGGVALSATSPAALRASSGATYTDIVSSGTVGSAPISTFQGMILAARNTVTYTTAATLYIIGAPTAGTNVTITNAYALYVAAGATQLQGTFTANSTVTLSPANASVAISPTGTGTVTINPATAGTINNMSIGATTASTGAFTTITAPTMYGGTTSSSTLTLQSTSGAGTTDSVVVKTGNNGAVTAATFNTAGVPLATNWYNTTTQTATNTATLTAAQITGPFLLSTPTAAAAYTLPLASAVDTALGTPAAGTGWEFVIFTNAAFVVTVTTNTGWTLVGTMTTGGTATSFARFRAYRTGTSAYTLYRIS